MPLVSAKKTATRTWLCHSKKNRSAHLNRTTGNLDPTLTGKETYQNKLCLKKALSAFPRSSTNPSRVKYRKPTNEWSKTRQAEQPKSSRFTGYAESACLNLAVDASGNQSHEDQIARVCRSAPAVAVGETWCIAMLASRSFLLVVGVVGAASPAGHSQAVSHRSSYRHRDDSRAQDFLCTRSLEIVTVSVRWVESRRSRSGPPTSEKAKRVPEHTGRPCGSQEEEEELTLNNMFPITDAIIGLKCNLQARF